jgi:hypothetical protein
MDELIEKFNYDMSIKLRNFSKYVRRQDLSRFLARYELFKKVKNIKGSIIECGVHHGGGLMTWAKLSSALEPYSIHRKVLGFDTFEGFENIHKNDLSDNFNPNLKKGGFDLKYDGLKELKMSIDLFDENRYLNQFEKVELIKGDALKTIPKYIEDNSHLIISLLFLDFDLYEPTRVALEHFLPLIPKGGIIAFDEVNNKFWPGETKAFLEKIGNINSYKLEKFTFDPNISYIILN